MLPAHPLRLLTVLAVLSLSLAACGGSTPGATGIGRQVVAKRTAAGCVRRNTASGTIKYSDWQFPDSLNPFQTTASSSFETINAIEDSLFTYDQRANVLPQMTTTIPTLTNGGVRDGGKIIILTLKRGLHWSNGAEITSKDVLFGWRIGMDKATGPYCEGSCDQISRIDTPTRYTVALHFKRVFAPAVPTAMPPVFPPRWPGGWNGNAHLAAEKLGQDSSYNFEDARYPTNGAYQVTDFIKDDRIDLRPMKHYTGMNCGAYVQNLIFAFFSSKPSMIAAASAGGTDVTQDYTTADLPELTKHAGAFTVSSIPGYEFEHLEFNLDKTYNGSPNPLANVQVRQALALSLDKIGLIRSGLVIDARAARSVASWTPWVNTPLLIQPFADPKVDGQWDPLQHAYVQPGTPQAVQDARTLLAQTPWKNGFSITIMTTTGNPVRSAQMGIMENNWAKIGVQVVPYFVPSSKLFAGWSTNGPLNHGNFQVAMFAFQGSSEPDTFKYEMEPRYIDRRQRVHSNINDNYSGIVDPVIARAFSVAAGTFDTRIRTRSYDLIQERLNQQAYWIGLYFRPSIATVDDRVENFSNNPTSAGPTWNIYDWKVRSAS